MHKATVEVIERLLPPSIVKGVRYFLYHAGFYLSLLKISLKSLNLSSLFSKRRISLYLLMHI